MNIGYLTQADDLTQYPLEWRDMVTRGKKVLSLRFTYDELKEEVNKRTAFLGKHRQAEGAEHLLDLVEMTEDEAPLFDSFVRTIAADLFDSFSKFSGNTQSTFSCSEDDNEVKYVFLVPDNINETLATPLDIATKDALVFGVIYQWLLMCKPDDAENYIAFYNNASKKMRERVNALNQPNHSFIVPRPY